MDKLSEPGVGEKFAQNLKSKLEFHMGDDDWDDDDIGWGDDDDAEDDGFSHRKSRSSSLRNRSSRSTSSAGRRSKQFREHLSRRHEPRSAVPKNCQIVPDDIEIPEGTKVAACFHSKWSSATVLQDNGDGTLEIDWDDHAEAFNGPLVREHMIIQNKTLKVLTGETGMTPNQLRKITRTWTDSSGQHKVEAKFLSKTDSNVTLNLKDGTEKTLPLDKLSEKDRTLLSKLKEETENPFAKDNPFD